MGITKKILGLIIGFFLIQIATSSCSSAKFMSKSGTQKQPDGNPDNSVVIEDGAFNPADWERDEAETGGDIFDKEGSSVRGGLEDTEGKLTFLTSQISATLKDHFWIATSNNNVYYFEIDTDKKVITEGKSWKIEAREGGTRTYVTEGGVVLARLGGYVFFIDPEKTPEGLIDQSNPLYHRITGIGDERVCAVSYRKDNSRFLGLGYGKGKFIEFPLADTPPYAPEWNNGADASINALATWGYSCAIDQRRLIYYGKWVNGAQTALDLKTMKEVSASTAPNAAFKSLNLANLTHGPAQGVGGAYAIFGDRDGNVYSGSGVYTYAHDSINDVMWVTSSKSGEMYTMARKCLTSEGNCAASDFSKFDVTTVTGGERFGPISALPGGQMIAAVRTKGYIYLLDLKDPKNLAAGINATRLTGIKVGEDPYIVQGDPYMYTDFTGSTLYLSNSTVSFDFKKSSVYKEGNPVRLVIFSWTTKAGESAVWSDLKMEARCYKSGTPDDQKPEFVEIGKVEDATKWTYIVTEDCRRQVVDAMDMKITQMNPTGESSDALNNIKQVFVRYFY